MDDLEPVPQCPTCGHEHSAAWTRNKLSATGPCYCGCLIETRTTLDAGDRSVWLDYRGRVWEWFSLNGLTFTEVHP